MVRHGADCFGYDWLGSVRLCLAVMDWIVMLLHGSLVLGSLGMDRFVIAWL